jgi:hypothetical protein
MKTLSFREERNIEELEINEAAEKLSTPFIKDSQEEPPEGLLSPTRLS